MIQSLSLSTKLNDSGFNEKVINGITPEQWALLYFNFFSLKPRNIFIFSKEEEAEAYFQSLKILENVIFYPELGSDIYEGKLSSEFGLLKRFHCLDTIVNSTEKITIVTTFKALSLNVPDKEYFSKSSYSINVSDIISREDLSQKLISLGYKRTPTTEESGTFSPKGEIFDIYPFDSSPKRIIFFDDMVEEIRDIDPVTLITVPNSSNEQIKFSKTQHTLLDDEYINQFANSFPRPPLNQQDKYTFRRQILKKLRNKYFFEDYSCYIGYFLSKKSTLVNFLEGFQVHLFNKHSTIEEAETYKNFLTENEIQYNIHSDDIKPDLDTVYNFDEFNTLKYLTINNVDLTSDLNTNITSHINLKLSDITSKLSLGTLGSKRAEALSEIIKKYLSYNKDVIICYEDKNKKNEIIHRLKTLNNHLDINNIKFLKFYLSRGFEYESENLLVLSSSDFFSEKIKKVKKKNTRYEKDMFAEQLGTMHIGDFIIHKDFGVGKYLGLETLELGESVSDYIIIEYKDGDKVYLPVYKLNLIQKYASNDTKAPLSNLKTQKFDAAKSKAKQSVKKLAFDLLELHAKRELQRGFQFSPPDQSYTDFSHSFKFEETIDQNNAIEDVLSDMTSNKPMDRLVCGDVGFGKTEVAMRAAFKALTDNKQVAVLVPTTVLSFQHYNSFTERFRDVAVNIEFISRFKTPKQVKDILVQLSEGKIDILIGTHKILSDKVKFKDLGLLIIDEEQRFGVAHKEKMKLLRENVDTLTLTATPIPRTLQMSFLGIKDLSIIKTAPPRRQTIKSYIIKDDQQTLKLAIEKELSRSGQIFIVHNRVRDIEIYSSNIQKLVPQARIIFAHGQMAERELEKRISDFYQYKYDILISTTIIESGIDIPRANTMIIDRADTFGLSQLHQLRGRIGRSDKKAYAYFIIPSFHNISEIANKRLKALQTYAELGSGFNLATSDLEIRGSGDILGAEQSGHIGTIGLELYMELLQDAINEIKGKPTIRNKNIEFYTPFNGFIPKEYMADASVRLKFYKKLSNSSSLEEIKDLIEEIVDKYGKLPEQIINLEKTLQSRVNLQDLAITSVKTKTSSILLSFDTEMLSSEPVLRDKILNFFMLRPKIYKINPDYSINCIFKDKININTLVDFTEFLRNKLNN